MQDSGAREEFNSGMVRDTAEGKTLFHLVADGPMLERWAEHLTKGAQKYEAGNWMKASGDAEYQRFRESAFRHFMQWYFGLRDEDHASAVFFNINGAEYVEEQEPEQEVELEVLPLTKQELAEALAQMWEPKLVPHWEDGTEGAHFAGSSACPGDCEEKVPAPEKRLPLEERAHIAGHSVPHEESADCTNCVRVAATDRFVEWDVVGIEQDYAAAREREEMEKVKARVFDVVRDLEELEVSEKLKETTSPNYLGGCV